MYEKHNVKVPLSRASRVFDISVAAILQFAEKGDLMISDDGQHIDIEECERWADARGYPESRLVRALSVLERFKTVYTTGEIARLLGVSTDLVIRLIDSGEIRGYRLPQTGPSKHGGDRRVTRIALAEYLSLNPCAQSESMGMRISQPQAKTNKK